MVCEREREIEREKLEEIVNLLDDQQKRAERERKREYCIGKIFDQFQDGIVQFVDGSSSLWMGHLSPALSRVGMW